MLENVVLHPHIDDTQHERFLCPTKRREVAEIVFNRNQRREAEINETLKQEAARRAAVVKNMQRLRALRLARTEKPKAK
jgi:hypothetical protein